MSLANKIRGGICVAALTIAVVVSPAQNVDNNTIFELEGNAVDAVPTPTGEDWSRYFPSGAPGGNAVAKVFTTDAANASIFVQGGSKDINGISQWRHASGAVPDKDDILNAYAAAYVSGGQLFIYFGADRFANTGDANIGFWFLQSNVSANADGTFSGAHVNGDIFVVAGFTSGGTTAEIDLYRWVGDDATGSLVLISSVTAGATCVPSATGSHVACAISNTSPQPSPWPYTPKAGPAGTFPIASFFEGGINLNALLPAGSSIPCFSTFLVETRSSTSLSAQLKDFSIGSFDLCNVAITKNCVNGRLNATGTALLYDVSGTVTNTGALPLFDVTVTDTFPAGSTPTTQNIVVGTVQPGITANWGPVTFSTTTNGGTNNATVAAASSAGGTKTITASANPATCPTLQLNPNMTVSKGCTTDLTAVSNHLAVQVAFSGQVCNTGNVTLTNVTVVNDKTGSTPASFNLGTIGPAANGTPTCKPYGPGTYLPSLATPGVGRYQFTDTVTATGTPPAISGNCGAQANCIATATATCPLCPAGSCPVP